MKPPATHHSTRVPTRAAVLRHLALVHVTNLSELISTYAGDVQSAVNSYVKHRLAFISNPFPHLVFLDGPYFLIDLSACLDGGSPNEDALCEHINALLMERPIKSGDDSVFLNIETTLIECSDKQRQLIQSGDISKLTNSVLATLRLGGQGKKEKTFRTDMALTSSLYSQLATGELVLAFQPILSVDDRSVVLYWESLLRRRANRTTLELTTCANQITAAERLGLVSRLDRSLLWTHVELLKKHPEINLGCNISAQSLKFDCWWRVLFEELCKQPEVAKRLTIEITETSFITENDEAVLLLQTLKLLGCNIAIDGMGAAIAL